MLELAVGAVALVLIASGAVLFWAAYRIVRRITGGGRDSAQGAIGCGAWLIAGPIAVVGAVLVFIGLTLFGLTAG